MKPIAVGISPQNAYAYVLFGSVNEERKRAAVSGLGVSGLGMKEDMGVSEN